MISTPRSLSMHSRYETLDGMRGFAALSVMFFHYTQFHQPRWLAYSPLAVDIFFMLSGFVIAHSYGKRLLTGMTATEYIAKRFIRLYPTFIMGILLGAPVLYWLRMSGHSNFPPAVIAASTLTNLFYLPFIHNYEIQVMGSRAISEGQVFPSNPPSWSLFFEVIASLGFLLLFRLKRSVLIQCVAVSLVLFLLCGFVHAHHAGDSGFNMDLGWGIHNLYGGFPRVIYGFSAGVLIYSFTKSERFHAVHAGVRRFLGNSYLIYLALFFIFAFPSSLHGFYTSLVLVIAAPCLVYVGSLANCPDSISLNIAKFLGWISYPLYCFHLPIGRSIFLIADRFHISNLAAVVIAGALSVAVAAILTKFCEEPARAYLSRKLSMVLKTPRSTFPAKDEAALPNQSA